MKIPWLEPDDPLPPPERALRRPNGLLAAGGGLSMTRLVDAYRRGCFPWFNPGEPVLWLADYVDQLIVASDQPPTREPHHQSLRRRDTGAAARPANVAPASTTRSYAILNSSGGLDQIVTLPFYTQRLEPQTGVIQTGYSVVDGRR